MQQPHNVFWRLSMAHVYDLPEKTAERGWLKDELAEERFDCPEMREQGAKTGYASLDHDHNLAFLERHDYCVDCNILASLPTVVLKGEKVFLKKYQVEPLSKSLIVITNKFRECSTSVVCSFAG